MSLAAPYSALANLDASTVSAVRRASWAAAIFCSLASCSDSRCCSAWALVICADRRCFSVSAFLRASTYFCSNASFSLSLASFSDRSADSSSAFACSAESFWILAFICSCSSRASAVLSLMFAMMASRRDSSRSFDCHSSRE